MACASAVAPLKLSWTNNTLDGGDGSVVPGFQVSIGSPPQQFSVLPTTGWDNFWVNQEAVCGTVDNKTCVQEVGGVFQQKQSSTFKSFSQSSWPGWTESFDYVIQDTLFTDVLSIGDTNLTDYPMYAQQTVNGQLGRLPLGLNSTFLDSLVKANLAPSKSYGLWVGDNSQSKPGLLTVGGYSESLFQQPYINRTTQIDCPACLVVSQLKYQTVDGEVDLLEGTGLSIVQAKLEPSHPYLSLPKQVFQNFMNATGGTKSQKNTLLEYSSSNRPTGQLVVTSNSGLTTYIPNTLLFGLPAFTIGDDLTTDGSTDFGLVEQYDSMKDPDFGDKNNIAILGMPYLSKIYLVRDYERELISIGNVVPTASENAEITTICPVVPGSSFSRPPGDGTDGNSTTSSPTTTPTNSSISNNHDHTGAIIGGVLGSVAGIALIFLALFFFLRRRKRQHVQPHELSASSRSSGWPDSSKGVNAAPGTYNSRSNSSGTLRHSAGSDDSKDPLHSPNPTHYELPTPLDRYPNVQGTKIWEKDATRDVHRSELPGNLPITELPT